MTNSFETLIPSAPKGRFDGIERNYSAADVIRLRGSFAVDHSLAKRTANRLWQMLHEEPQVPNFGRAGKGPRLKPGLVLAIEPMVNAGSKAVQVDPDGWTARTKDGSLSAHFEYSVAVTPTGPRILGLSEILAAREAGVAHRGAA